jgi:hypothetical protein
VLAIPILVCALSILNQIWARVVAPLLSKPVAKIQAGWVIPSARHAAGFPAGSSPLVGNSLQSFKQRRQSGPTFCATMIARSRCIFLPPTGRKDIAQIEASAAAGDKATPQDLHCWVIA